MGRKWVNGLTREDLLPGSGDAAVWEVGRVNSVPCVNLEHMVAGNENIGISDCWLTLRGPRFSHILWATPCYWTHMERLFHTRLGEDEVRYCVFRGGMFVRCPVLGYIMRLRKNIGIHLHNSMITHMVKSLDFYTFKWLAGV